MSKGFDVFLSYSSADQHDVEAMAKALQAEPFALEPFLDRWHLRPGRNWVEALEQNISQSRAVAVFIGPEGFGRWQQRECNAALNRQAMEETLPVIPVLLPGASDPGLGFLALNTWVDLSGGVTDPQGIDALAKAIRGEAPDRDDRYYNPLAHICPYRGLEPFREEDAGFFFGRDAFVDQLIEKIGTRNFLTVLGASGSGKSSVVRAGLMPELRKGVGGKDGRSWSIFDMKPGHQPLHALVEIFDPPPEDQGRIKRIAHLDEGAEALRAGKVSLRQLVDSVLSEEPGTDQVLLFVDQFEELYTQAPKMPEQIQVTDQTLFLDLLLAATEGDLPLTVVSTLRADFLNEVLKRPGMDRRFQDSDILIGPLARIPAEGEGRSELESVIRAPAEKVGLTFEEGLSERIMADVGEEPGNLPLLEYLLKSLWGMRERGNLLTHEAYTTLGGVEGAIAKRAQETFDGLSPEEQEATRRLFLGLVTPGEGQEDTRARAQLPEDEMMSGIVQAFTDQKKRFLVTSSDPTLGRVVEVSHEALIRNWGALKQWIADNREDLRVRDRIVRKMGEWLAQEKPDDLLLPKGIALEEGRTLLGKKTDVRTDDLAAFINAAIAADQARIDAERAKERAEVERRAKDAEEIAAAQKRATSRTRLGLVAATVLALLAGGTAWWGLGQRDDAVRLAEVAKSRAEDARESFRVAKSEKHRADQRAREANDSRRLALVREHEADDRLREAQITESRFLAGKALDLAEEGNAGDALALAYMALAPKNSNGSRPTTPEATLALYKARYALHERTILRGHEGTVWSAVFSPKGDAILSASEDNTARLWGPVTGEQRAILKGHESTVYSAVFNSKGDAILTASGDTTARLWDPVTGERRAILKGHEDTVNSAVFSPKGDAILTASGDTTARLWDPVTGEQRAILKGHERTVRSAVFSPNGDAILTASGDNTARLWDPETGKQRAILKGHTSGVLSALYSSKDDAILTTSEDKTARIWDPITGEQRAVLKGHGNWVQSAVLSPSGDAVLTASQDGTARVWDPVTGKQRIALVGHEDGVFSAVYSPNGDAVLTASEDNTARLWDAVTGKLRAILKGHDRIIRSAVFSPSGDAILTRSSDNTARLWDPETGEQRAILNGHEGSVTSAVFSPSGDAILTASTDDTARLWDPETGKQRAILIGHEKRVWSAVFSLSGDAILTASGDNTARLWDYYGPPDALFAGVEEMLTSRLAHLTWEECRTYYQEGHSYCQNYSRNRPAE